MANAAAITHWAITGQRPGLIPRGRRLSGPPSGARTVRTASGVALFDELGRYVGRVLITSDAATFGPCAETVLLSRDTE
jgi:hypothetical protein